MKQGKSEQRVDGKTGIKQTGSVLRGTLILSVAALLVKILGAGYRIYLARLIGTEGIGLYQMAYPIYLIFLSLSTAGIPIAISKIVAEKVSAGDLAGIQSTFKAAFLLLFGLGITCSAGMILSARWVATNLLADFRAVYSIWALAPGIFLMSLTSVFRGYFQGWLEMQPSAWSQIYEQIVRVAVALVLASMLLIKGVERAAAGAAFGATVGGAAALCYLALCYGFRVKTQRKRVAARIPWHTLVQSAKTVIRFALPISIAVVLTPLLQALDSVIVPRRLQEIGYTVGQATSMLGLLGNSWAVVYLPLIVTTAIATNLVPAVAVAKTERTWGQLEGKVAEGLRMALLYLIPVCVMMSLYGRTFYRIIYGQRNVDLLVWLAPAVLFLGLEQVAAGIIQGLGRPKWPLYSFVAGSMLKVAVTVVLIGWPGLNLAGAALGTVCGAAVTALINLVVIRRLTGVQSGVAIPVLIAGAVMYGGCFGLQSLLHSHYLLELALTGSLGGLVYLVILVILGGITLKDLETLKMLMHKKEREDG